MLFEYGKYTYPCHNDFDMRSIKYETKSNLSKLPFFSNIATAIDKKYPIGITNLKPLGTINNILNRKNKL